MEEAKFAPKCIWCSAPWSDDNVRIYDSERGSWGSDSMGSFTDVTLEVAIVCHECGKEVYRRGGFERTY